MEERRTSPGLFARIGRALSGIGKVARLALGSGGRGEDLTQDFSISRHEADAGAKKLLRVARDGATEEILVTIPSGTRAGTTLRLRGKGLKGRSSTPGDLYLRVHVAD
jgi:DnaJ-class molecular chaperone